MTNDDLTALLREARQVINGDIDYPLGITDRIDDAVTHLLHTWTPVTEGMPPNDDEVRCFGEVDGVLMQFDGFFGAKYAKWYPQLNGVSVLSVTHWMPLPPDPKP